MQATVPLTNGAGWVCALARLAMAFVFTTASVLILGVTAVATSLPVAAGDQVVGTTYGAVTGKVTDGSGGALEGVAVRLSSASLMGVRVTATTHDGRYVFRALAPGAYTVAFERSGFRPMFAEARVSAGVSSTVDAILQLAALADAVTVETHAGAIDRRTTAVTETFTQEQLSALPGSRSMFSILSSTPGIQVARFEVGGNTGDAGAPFGAYGTRGSNRPMVEGMMVAQIFPLGFTLDYGAFEEVTVRLAAHGPEWPVPGVQMQFIAKSGGNRYRGTCTATWRIDAGSRATSTPISGGARILPARVRSPGTPTRSGGPTISTAISAGTSLAIARGGTGRRARRTWNCGR